MEQLIRDGHYNNKLEYPSRPKKPSPPSATVEDAKRFTTECKTYEEDLATFKKLMNEYRENEDRLHQQFKDDLLEEMGIDGYEKKDAVFDYVWREGHSSGLHNVYQVMNELVEILPS